MLNLKDIRGFFVLMLLAAAGSKTGADPIELGPLVHQFKLTLDAGYRTEAFGPFYNTETRDSTRVWASPPLLAYTLDEQTDFEEFDFLYPLITYSRFGPEYRFQIIQLLAFAGGGTMSDTNVHRFTVFPFYFQQRSEIPDRNYTALIPIYGHLKNRFFRDDVHFVLMPLYVRSQKRDVVTVNAPYPIFHWRHGIGLKGWQVWPLVGHEHKAVTQRTNHWEEVEVVPGHDKLFAGWPLFFRSRLNLGTDNPERHDAFLPLYSIMRSPQRESTTIPWPFGVTYTIDRVKKYREWGAPWPLIVFARGEGKTANRVWPLFSKAYNQHLESTWYLWPVYKFNRVNSAPLDRRRTRVLLFLYSDLVEKNTETGKALHRIDFWPLFTSRRDFEGNHRLQVFSILEPVLPNNSGVERNYSPIWSVWRQERNGRTGATSQSLLWNLYRRESSPDSKKCSLLFGLFKYQSSAGRARWRLLYVPLGNRNKAEPATSKRPD